MHSITGKTKVSVGGTLYELVHDFGGGRGIINMEGAFALVDALPVAGDWELSGEPARDGEEKTVLKRFTDTIGTQTTVTAPDGSTQTFKDE